jgi:protein-S-isoprenylcysteine O-methyltransferase Ste14
MSRWGVGPVFALLSISYGAICLIITRRLQPVFNLEFLPQGLRLAVGVLLVVFGLGFFLAAVRGVTLAYNVDQLITSGVFRFCRHPLYASWVVFIAPGIILLANSWLGLSAPVFMYVLLCKLVQKEEQYLSQRFGKEYTAYQRKTPCIMPYGFLR